MKPKIKEYKALSKQTIGKSRYSNYIILFALLALFILLLIYILQPITQSVPI